MIMAFVSDATPCMALLKTADHLYGRLEELYLRSLFWYAQLISYALLLSINPLLAISHSYCLFFNSVDIVNNYFYGKLERQNNARIIIPPV
jgi:hypothetical protein